MVAEDAAPMATTSSYGVDFFTSMVSRVLPPDTITMDALAIKPEALDDARAALAELPVKHYNEKEARRCQLEEQFPLWAFQLRCVLLARCSHTLVATHPPQPRL